MRDGIRELFAEEFAEEWKRGEREGVNQEQHDRIATMLLDGRSPEEIADFCKYPLSLITEIQASLFVEA